MRLIIKKHQVNIDTQAIILAALLLGWALYYYFSTISIPDGGTESVLFIKPLVIGLFVFFIFIIWGAVELHPRSEVKRQKEEPTKKDGSFLHHRRIFFAASLVAYGIGLTFFGYLIPSVLFIFFVCFCFGVRNLWILIGLSIALPTFMSLVFRMLIHVPVPIWPSW